ncbi:MAG: GTP pyrophosphokinase family protein [Clostridia bacterium]|nr:GTP pyrophosphokinase family protein [Clostridia bacterium]
MTEINKVKEKLKNTLSETDVMEMTRNFNDVRELMTYYQCAIMEVETKFRVLNERFKLSIERNPIDSITSRLKSLDSIVQKLERKKLPMTVEAIEQNLFDVAGIRIICSFVDDIYMLADCLVSQDDIKLVRVKDYIKNPKENGYRSLHLIVEVPIFLENGKRSVKVEVQLRTIAMEFWANLEHQLRYKKNLSLQLLRSTSRELSECARISAALDMRMQSVRDIINGK